MHGQQDTITTKPSKIFKNTPNPLNVGRYHALATKIDSPYIKVTARNTHHEIMAIEHINQPIYGLQFHPESILTEYGQTIIDNFIEVTHENLA